MNNGNFSNIVVDQLKKEYAKKGVEKLKNIDFDAIEVTNEAELKKVVEWGLTICHEHHSPYNPPRFECYNCLKELKKLAGVKDE